MANSDINRGIHSAKTLEFQKQPVRSFYRDEKRFKSHHNPMSTENEELLQKYFDERTKLENEKYELWEQKIQLVKNFDNLSCNLMEVRKRETSTVEEEKSKNEEIIAIENQIQKNAKKEKKLDENIKKKEEEIDEANEKINAMIKIVIKDEYELFKQTRELERNNKVGVLINKL